nr:Major Facilitator Superfamily [uncultured bacterium]
MADIAQQRRQDRKDQADPNRIEGHGGENDDIAWLFGAMLAAYAIMQFVASPILGVLSDRFGRRPVLLLSLAGAAIDYLIMAFAPELWMLVLGRAVSGITSACSMPCSALASSLGLCSVACWAISGCERHLLPRPCSTPSISPWRFSCCQNRGPA